MQTCNVQASEVGSCVHAHLQFKASCFEGQPIRRKGGLHLQLDTKPFLLQWTKPTWQYEDRDVSRNAKGDALH